MNIEKNKVIIHLIIKKLLGDLNNHEMLKLQSWINESPENAELFKKYSTLYSLKELNDTSSKIDINKSISDMENRMNKIHQKRFKPYLYYVAASIAIFIGVFFLVKNVSHDDTGINSDSRQITITLPTGEVMGIDELQNDKTLNTIVNSDGTELNYTNLNMDSILYNEIYVPIGSEFLLTFSDNSKVWINSDTKIKYPSKFKSDIREVYIEGEAYFDIVRDTTCPFIVRSYNDFMIEVVGTSFNVRAYKDEKIIETVLEKGMVHINSLNKRVLLTPGMMALCDSESVKTKTVDTELYTAWKSGNYIFREQSIYDILERLSKWYDFTVEYRNESMKNILFTGNVKKYQDITPLLNAMEASGSVHFDNKGKIIIVY